MMLSSQKKPRITDLTGNKQHKGKSSAVTVTMPVSSNGYVVRPLDVTITHNRDGLRNLYLNRDFNPL